MLKIFSLTSMVLLLMSCSGPETIDSLDSERPVVVATTTHLADLARQIGGQSIQVEALMKPGVDPHSYRATAHDITLLHRADLILYHGLSLEGKLSRLLEGDPANERTPFSPCKLIAKNELIFTSEENSLVDPHLWFSPKLWGECGLHIRDQLCQTFPDQAEQFQANFLVFEKSLREIDQWAKAVIGQIPKDKRVLITSHDAFQYFGKYFQIEVVALQGINTNVEAGLSDRARFTSTIRKYQSPALFVESSVNPKALQEIARETGAVIGGTLFSDALGPVEQWAITTSGKKYSTGTWQGMMIHNIQTIEVALKKAR